MEGERVLVDLDIATLGVAHEHAGGAPAQTVSTSTGASDIHSPVGGHAELGHAGKVLLAAGLAVEPAHAGEGCACAAIDGAGGGGGAGRVVAGDACVLLRCLLSETLLFGGGGRHGGLDEGGMADRLILDGLTLKFFDKMVGVMTKQWRCNHSWPLHLFCHVHLALQALVPAKQEILSANVQRRKQQSLLLTTSGSRPH